MSELRALPYSWREVRTRLQRDLPVVLSRLFPGARIPPGPLFSPLNPTRADRTPGSFVIYLDGDRAGGWVEYAAGGARGDVIDLVAYVLRLHARIDAYWWALEHLGLDRGVVRTAAVDRQARETAERDAAAAQAREAAAQEAKSSDLARLWFTLDKIDATPAEHYLREARRIDLSRLSHLPRALRWARECEWIDPATGEVTTWRNCMVAGMTRGTKIVALHRTYLRADGSAKAAIDKPKLMIGPARGAAIRLTTGPSGLSPTRAAAAGKFGPLAIGEGIETTLTVACARPDFRCWAAGSLSLMGTLDWPACADAVVLLGENDTSPEAVAAFARVEAHWRDQARGRRVAVVRPKLGGDFNDWARAA